MQRLLEAPNNVDAAPIIQLRDRSILELFFSTGMRVSELANMRKDQLNLEREEFSVRGKGDKIRIVFLSRQARQALRVYLDLRKDDSPYLFIRHDRGRGSKQDDEVGPLTPRSIERLVHHYAVAAGIPKRISPHTLRHSFATDLLMNGADIRSVQSLLGHSSITTTQIYTHITNQQLKDVFQAFHGKQQDEVSEEKGRKMGEIIGLLNHKFSYVILARMCGDPGSTQRISSIFLSLITLDPRAMHEDDVVRVWM